MTRRAFITLLGGAAAWPLAVPAQTAIAIIGFLSSRSSGDSEHLVTAFRLGLKETGYVEGDNAVIAFRWAEGRYDRLPAQAAELARQRVAVIVAAGGNVVAFAAKAATQTIPIVFMQGADPVRIGLVDSLNRPGGNLTGFGLLSAETAAKRLELLLELVPKATSIGYLRNPTNPAYAEAETREVQAAASAHGLWLLTANASSPSEIETTFADLLRQGIDALQVSSDGFLLTHPDQIVALAARHAVPAIYAWRQFMAVGGLISYGTNIRDGWRQAGIYTGRILKGEKPSELPVQQVTKIELIINLKTAKTLGLTVPLPLSGLADEVIE